MRKNKEIAKEICQKLGGFFGRHNVYVGGSLGLELQYPILKQSANSDIDIFILIPRMESWAINYIVKFMDDFIIYDCKILEKCPEYKIDKQWKRIKGNVFPEDVNVDFIFVDNTINSVVKDTAADISKFYFTLNYNNMFRLEGHFESAKIMQNIFSGKCQLNIAQATDDHQKKCIEKCKNFGLKVVEV